MIPTVRPGSVGRPATTCWRKQVSLQQAAVSTLALASQLQLQVLPFDVFCGLERSNHLTASLPGPLMRQTAVVALPAQAGCKHCHVAWC